MGNDPSVEALARLSAGAESTGWTRVGGRPWREEMWACLGLRTGAQSVGAGKTLKTSCSFCSWGNQGPEREVLFSQGHMASCSRVRDGTQNFKTEERVWAVAELGASPTGPRLLLTSLRVAQAWALSWDRTFSFPAMGNWKQLRRSFPPHLTSLYLAPNLRSHLTVDHFNTPPHISPSHQYSVDNTDDIL